VPVYVGSQGSAVPVVDEADLRGRHAAASETGYSCEPQGRIGPTLSRLR
jgi:hypothetical protein